MHPRVVMLAESSDAGDTRASSALKQAGYQVHVLTLEMDPDTIARFKPQAVVFDVGRQSANAYEFLTQLRKHRNLKGAVMIGVLGEKESNRSRRAEDLIIVFESRSISKSCCRQSALPHRRRIVLCLSRTTEVWRKRRHS